MVVPDGINVLEMDQDYQRMVKRSASVFPSTMFTKTGQAVLFRPLEDRSSISDQDTYIGL